MKTDTKEIAALKKEIRAIKARNRRVESDKAWETSRTRAFFIALSTYIIVALFFLAIDAQRPFMSALVPTIGYLLSTATYEIIKKWWLKKRRVNYLTK